ncbi:ORF36 [Felid gammaherpesvirus 1]|uniref:ORF36 n=1 Tax=Felid gammaherpesvirus 1 TaxID=2560468 RepID=A0A0M4M145_9GAMA|nr:ORF36 [Felis catus gammaherpesvirus 1]ALE14748.1 ORF36 [Felis catus gammaherpesvirus 1]
MDKKTLTKMRTLQILSYHGSFKDSPMHQNKLQQFKESDNDGVLAMLLNLQCHLSIVEANPTSVFFKIPSRWKKCNHSTAKIKLALGSGSYGSVTAISKTECVKTFSTSKSFFHEMMVYDLVDIARMRSTYPQEGANIITMDGVCLKCKQLFFPRMQCNLYEYKHWTVENVSRLVRGFNGLLDAVLFLNEKCGFFHSDISPCNILVKQGFSQEEIGDLILSDLGLVSLHTGNRILHMGIKSSRGKVLYEMSSERGPFSVCKDLFKPACILFRCFMITADTRSQKAKFDCFLVDQQMARVIDVSSLALCLLYSIEQFMDVQKAAPTPNFYTICVVEDESPSYYMTCLIPRVVLLEFLSNLWHLKLDIGASSDGTFKHLNLCQQDKHNFQSWCNKAKKLYQKNLFYTSSILLSDPNLKFCLANLLSLDYFSPCGSQAL